MIDTAIAERFQGSFLKPFGEKAYEFAFRDPKQDKLINLLWGTVRSSKTWAVMVKLIGLLNYKTEGHNVIFGVSKQTIKNNVLDDLFTLLTPKRYTYNRQSGELSIMGQKWLVIGAKDEGSEKYVRGLTIGKAIGDEWTLLPPSFIKMVQNRMSVEGARLYGTTNTDTPAHFVKTDIIDRLAGTDLLWEQKFTLEDNPWNRAGYRADLEKQYPPGSLYHQRFVLGEWVTGEGSIYASCWNDKELCYDGPCPVGQGVGEETIAIDCGVTHRQVYLSMFDDGDTAYCDREYVWDSLKTYRQKTDGQYADDLEAFMRGEPIAGACSAGRPCKDALVLIPPECASFEAEIALRGIWHLDANNEVDDGIRMVSSMMALRKIKFSRERCPQTIAKLPAYVWDKEKAKRGIEEPLKKDDDEPDAVRYFVKSRIPNWRIAVTGKAA